jgi:hypothetical protein
MRKLSVSFFLLAFLAPFVSGCNTATTDNTQQDFGNILWKPDGSGMYGLFERQLINVATDAYMVGIFDGQGALTGTVPTSDNAINPDVFLDRTASHAVVQLGANLYKLDLPGGGQTLLTTKVRLFVVSPDLHYAVVTPSPDGSHVRTISVLDLQSSPVREVKKWDVAEVSSRSGIWLKNGTFGLTVNVGGAQIDIFDTTGALVDSVQTAEQVFHNGNYIAATNDLYVRTGSSGVDRINLTTRVRDHLFSTEAVDDFDVSFDGKLLAVRTGSGISVLNTKTLAKSFVTNDAIYWGVFLAPAGDQVAYIHQQTSTIRDIHVLSVSLP